MKLFVVIAALMALAAATAVAWPLWRDRSARLAPLASVILILSAAAVLYASWSTWDWSGQKQIAAQGPDVAAMVAKLERRLAADPNDADGWVMLGRSYVALERFDDSIEAYRQALKLSGANLEAGLGLGEALAMRAGGQVTAEAAQRFEDALQAAPQNPKALLFGGFAAAARGDKALARTRWEALKAQNPPPEIIQLLDQRIASLEGSAAPGAAATSEPATSEPATSEPATSARAPSAGASASVRIRIAPDLAARAKAGAPLFVFAQEPGMGGPPLAVKRLSTRDIGTTITLTAADSMIPSRSIHAGQTVAITARVSFGGQPIAARGDLYGEVNYDVGRDGIRELLIDHIAQ